MSRFQLDFVNIQIQPSKFFLGTSEFQIEIPVITDRFNIIQLFQLGFLSFITFDLIRVNIAYKRYYMPTNHFSLKFIIKKKNYKFNRIMYMLKTKFW